MGTKPIELIIKIARNQIFLPFLAENYKAMPFQIASHIIIGNIHQRLAIILLHLHPIKEFA